MTGTKINKRAQNKARDERLNQISAALADERARFNAAIYERGIEVVMDTAFGPYVVKSVDGRHDYHTYPATGRRDEYSRRTFCGCNDGCWADLLRQAGVERNPMAS